MTDWRDRPPIKLSHPIESQTPEQEAAGIALREQYKSWAFGSSDNLQAPIPEIQGAVRDVLALAKVADRPVIVVDGPLLAQLAASTIKAGANLATNLETNLWTNLRTNLATNLRANLGANLWDNLRDNLWDNLRDNLGANLRANLWDNLWDNLATNLRANLGDNLGTNLATNLRANLRTDQLKFTPVDWLGASGQWWICYYEHIARNLMPEHCPDDLVESIAKVRRLFELGVAGALTFEGAVIVWRRPSYAKYDERNRPHCATGPQVLWQDGFKQYAYHGVQIPHDKAWIIEDPASITADKALAENNVELRRVMVEQMGLERFIAGAQATVVDEVEERDLSGNPIRCRLLRLHVDGGDADLALTEVTCPSTGKVIHEEVPLEVATSYRAAWAWQFDTEPEHYGTLLKET